MNSLVWARCPKHNNYGVNVVRSAAAAATFVAVLQAERERVMQRLAIRAGELTKKSFALKRQETGQKV